MPPALAPHTRAQPNSNDIPMKPTQRVAPLSPNDENLAEPHQSISKMIKRRSSKPIINWFQKKLAGKRERDVERSVRKRDAAGATVRGRSNGHVGPGQKSSSLRFSRQAQEHPARDRSFSPNATTYGRSMESPTSSRRSLSLSIRGPGSAWSPSSPLEADDDASIRPLPPTSPPSPAPSRSTHNSSLSAYYGSDVRSSVTRSAGISTKPTTLVSVDLGYGGIGGGGMAHIAQAPNSVHSVAMGPPAPQMARFPSTRSTTNEHSHAAHASISTSTSITFSALPTSNVSRPSTSNTQTQTMSPSSADNAFAVQAPSHTLPHPRNNPRPASTPPDNASILTLASSTFAFASPRGHQGTSLVGTLGDDTGADMNASMRALRPRSRRGSWGSDETGWSVAGGSVSLQAGTPTGGRRKRPASTRTAGSWRTTETGGDGEFGYGEGPGAGDESSVVGLERGHLRGNSIGETEELSISPSEPSPTSPSVSEAPKQEDTTPKGDEIDPIEKSSVISSNPKSVQDPRMIPLPSSPTLKGEDS
jgi:hypothetical protein